MERSEIVKSRSQFALGVAGMLFRYCQRRFIKHCYVFLLCSSVTSRPVG
jgi:hypothetical protein